MAAEELRKRRKNKRMKSIDFEQAVELLCNERTRVSKPGISRVRELLHRLKDPQKDCPIVHIVGTNGKGSVTTMLSAIFTAAGYRVGAMLSPFQESVYDYYRINTALVNKQEFCRTAELVTKEAEQMADAPTEFERCVVVGLLLFASAGCEIVFLEAGMGGGNDATHVAEHALLTVVTHIALDHTQWLGDSLKSILQEKMSIAGEGDSVLLSPNSPQVQALAKEIAAQKNQKLYFCERQALSEADGTVSYGDFKKLRLGMAGRYQHRNLAAVLEALPHLKKSGFIVSKQAVREGLMRAGLAYRFQICRENPYLILDGGHNPDGVEALCESLALLPAKEPFCVVTGVMKDKAYEQMYARLDAFSAEYLTISPENPRAFDAKELAAYLKRYKKPVGAAADYKEAAKWIRSRLNENRPVLVTGTLYMMQALMTALKEEHVL